MPLDIVNVHFDCAGSQNLGGWSVCLSRLRSRCGAVRILVHGGHFSWQAQGKPHVLVLQSRLFVTGAAVLLRNGVTLTLTLTLTLTHTHSHSHSHPHSLSHSHSHFITAITSLDRNASRSLDFLLTDLTHTVWGLLPG